MSAKKYSLLSCFSVFLFLVSSAAQAADFFVAPGGNDARRGSLEEPFAAPARALEAARRVKDEPVTIHLRGGVYQLDKPLTFTPEDARTDKAPLTIRAYQDERPILSAGVKLTGWQVGDDGRWRMTLDAVKNGQWDFGQLFVGDQRRPRPRVPATDYFNIASNMPPTEANNKRGFDRFQFKEADLKPDWSNLTDVELVAFHQWSTSRMRVASIDADQKVVNFTGTTPGLAGWTDFATNHRYFVVNSQIWQVRRSRVEDHRSFIFDRNIVYWTLDTPLLGSNWKDGAFDMDHNLYWHDGKDFDFAGMSLDKWREMGKGQHSIIADPLFVDATANDFRLRENSPAKQIGFETWDYTRAGRLTPRSLTKDMPTVPATYE